MFCIVLWLISSSRHLPQGQSFKLDSVFPTNVSVTQQTQACPAWIDSIKWPPLLSGLYIVSLRSLLKSLFASLKSFYCLNRFHSGAGDIILGTKKGNLRINGHISETKKQFVVGPSGKIVATHSATNILLAKIEVTKPKKWFFEHLI